jgi:hypothetical protein
MIASKEHLIVKSEGTFAANKFLSLVDETLNAYQPCTATHAGASPTSGTQGIYSGKSAANANSMHTVNTSMLSSSKTFALCYAEGDGSTTDASWADSGLRLQTPKVTSIRYMHPVRELTATSCFGDIGLWGPADCRRGAAGAANGATATVTTVHARNSMLPRHPGSVISYHGPAIGAVLSNGKHLSLVEHTLGAQTNNPCRDGSKAAAVPTGSSGGGGADARYHSGVMTAGAANTSVTIPQLTGNGAHSDLLDYTKTFAVCYAEGDGSASDATWRDSYIRITLGKIATLTASDMVVTTRGMFANVPSLRITHTGSLATNTYLAIVDANAVAYPSSPCDKAYAGDSAYRRPYTSPQDSTTDTNLRSPALQAGPGSKLVDFDTSRLNGNGNLYVVCYAEGDGSAIDGTWMDSGIRLRFVKWTNYGKTRIASGSASQLTFQINEGTFSPANDVVVLLNGATDCSAAPSATALSNGNKVKRALGAGGTVTLPSGTGVTDASAIGWHQCTGGACTARGAYNDLNLNEGPYMICLCDDDNGNGGCDAGNEYVKVTSPVDSALRSLVVISAPRLGRVNLTTSHLGSVRALTGKSHIYNLKGSSSAGYEVANSDRVFFRDGDCSAIPTQHGPGATAPLNVSAYDSTITSSTYQAARVTTPLNLTTGPGGATRSLVACFATSQSLKHDSTARNYVQLADGLEVIPYPRLGPLASPDHVRALTGATPSFLVNPLKHGDQLFFKRQAAQGIGATDDCVLSSQDVHGMVVSAIPGKGRAPAPGSDNTGLLMGAAFTVQGAGKVTLPALSAIDGGHGLRLPLYLSTCFIPAGALDVLQTGTNCPVDSPNVNSNANGGTCLLTLANAVKLQDDLTVFPEPTDALVTSWFRSRVYEFKFTQPQFGTYGTKTFSAGQVGDIVVLQKNNCQGVHLITPQGYAVGSTHSAKMVLEEHGGEVLGDEKGGTARVKGIAMGKVNELGIGMYKVCYATRNSEGDDENDFKTLGVEMEILPDTATRPDMSVPRSVLLGQDLVVEWTSTINLQTRLQTENSWIGLYHNGSCMPNEHGTSHGREWGYADNMDLRVQIDNTQAVAPVSVQHQDYIETDAHECYVAYRFIPGGVSSGSVIFSQQDYQVGGTYDVRFFQGDSRNAQGRVCRGLADAPHETYVHCVLESALVSGPIEVIADRAKMDDLDATPGLEVLFNGNRGRYNDQGTVML